MKIDSGTLFEILIGAKTIFCDMNHYKPVFFPLPFLLTRTI